MGIPQLISTERNSIIASNKISLLMLLLLDENKIEQLKNSEQIQKENLAGWTRKAEDENKVKMAKEPEKI